MLTTCHGAVLSMLGNVCPSPNAPLQAQGEISPQHTTPHTHSTPPSHTPIHTCDDPLPNITLQRVFRLINTFFYVPDRITFIFRTISLLNWRAEQGGEKRRKERKREKREEKTEEDRREPEWYSQVRLIGPCDL